MQLEKQRRRTGTALVLAQFGLILMCLLPVGPVIGSGQLRPLGLVCLALAALVGGLALAAMGSDTRVHPVPDSTATLRTNGIYAWIRHPMYAAVLLACLSVVLSTGRVLAIVAFGALVVVLRAKARFEDRLLGEKFGAPYADYAARVPALIPRLRRSAGR